MAGFRNDNASNTIIVICSNSVGGVSPTATYQTKANAGELNKWCRLSMH